MIMNNQILFQTRCCDCKYNDENICTICKYEKMYKKRCYLSYISEKMKRNPKSVLKMISELNREDKVNGDVLFLFRRKYPLEEWRTYDTATKKVEASATITWIFQNETIDRKFDDYQKLMVSYLNTIYDAWRDKDIVYCLRCGAEMQNNKRHNRKYCDKCRNKLKKPYYDDVRICPDCGNEFFLYSFHNRRSYRCEDCQVKANKEAAKIRAKRFRERKNNDIKQIK